MHNLGTKNIKVLYEQMYEGKQALGKDVFFKSLIYFTSGNLIVDNLFCLESQHITLVSFSKEVDTDAVGHSDVVHHEFCTAISEGNQLEQISCRQQILHCIFS